VAHGFSAAWGRLFLPYGSGDQPQRLVPTVLTALITGKPVETTHGNQTRDFIDARDAADLLVRLLISSEGGAFNIGTGNGATVRSVIEYLADRYRGRELPRFGAIAPSAAEPAVLVADMTKVKARLGWSASTNIAAGLDRAIAQADFAASRTAVMPRSSGPRPGATPG
jgi:nucleoside-diphosphate-sugar epimerase